MNYKETMFKSTYVKVIHFLSELEKEREFRYLTKKEEQIEDEILSFFERMNNTLID